MHRNGSLLNGNITTAPLNGTPSTFAFDCRNRLASVGNTSYTYNAENQRIGITENGVSTSYVINPNAALSQTLIKTTGGVSTYYVYGLGLIAEETGTDYKTYHYDLRGSTVALADNVGLVTDTFSYAPYGELLSHTGTSDVDYLYNGRDGVIADNNGLYQMRARYYSPEFRRFLNEDEYAGKYDDILNVNLYAYCEGNPVGFVDPSGYDHEIENQDFWHSGTTQQDLQETYDFLIGDAISTIQDPNASSYEKAFAVSTLLPYGKMASLGGKAVLKIGNRAIRIAPDVVKYLDNEVGGIFLKSGIKGREEITSLYRAVGPEEFYEVMETGSFSVNPRGMQAKQFGLNLKETIQFAENYKDIGAVIEVKIPKNVIDKLGDLTHVDEYNFKSGTLTIQPENLGEFNNLIQSLIHKY